MNERAESIVASGFGAKFRHSRAYPVLASFTTPTTDSSRNLDLTMSGTALVLVDVQNDFLPPNGALAVGGGNEILPVILKLLQDPSRFDIIVATIVRRVYARFIGSTTMLIIRNCDLSSTGL